MKTIEILLTRAKKAHEKERQIICDITAVMKSRMSWAENLRCEYDESVGYVLKAGLTDEDTAVVPVADFYDMFGTKRDVSAAEYKSICFK